MIPKFTLQVSGFIVWWQLILFTII
jgi:hypothetical protein